MQCLLSALSGAQLVHDVGLLDHGDLICLELMVLTDEIADMVRRIVGGIEVSDTTMSVDLIDEIGPGREYISSEHTLRHFREFWYTGLFDRSRYEIWARGDRLSLSERLNRKVQQVLATHEVEPLADDITRELAELEKKWRQKAEEPAGGG